MSVWVGWALVGLSWVGKPVAHPTHIVSLAPAWTETLFAIGCGPKVVGVTRYDDNPPAVRELPRVGGMLDPSVERIASLNPSMVVSSVRVDASETLWSASIPTAVLPSATVADFSAGLSILAALCGTAEQGKATLLAFRDELSSIEPFSSPPPRVAIIVGRRPWVVAAATSFLGQALMGLGAVIPLGEGPPFPIVSEETLVSVEVDAIVDLSMGERTTIPLPSIRTLTPTRDPLVRMGPRFPRALAALRQALQPRSAP